MISASMRNCNEAAFFRLLDINGVRCGTITSGYGAISLALFLGAFPHGHPPSGLPKLLNPPHMPWQHAYDSTCTQPAPPVARGLQSVWCGSRWECSALDMHVLGLWSVSPFGNPGAIGALRYRQDPQLQARPFYVRRLQALLLAAGGFSVKQAACCSCCVINSARVNTRAALALVRGAHAGLK